MIDRFVMGVEAGVAGWRYGRQTWSHTTPFALSAAKGLTKLRGSFATVPLLGGQSTGTRRSYI